MLGQLADGHIVHDIARSGHTQPEVVLLQVDSIVEKLQVSSWLDAVDLANAQDPPLTG